MAHSSAQDFPCCPGKKPSCIGMVKFDCCGSDDHYQQLPKYEKLSLSNEGRNKAATERSTEIVVDDKVAKMERGYTPVNTCGMSHGRRTWQQSKQRPPRASKTVSQDQISTRAK